MRTSISQFQVCKERHENLTRQKVWRDPDACMNDLSVLTAPVGGEEDKHLLGRRWVRGERRDFLIGMELGSNL